MKKNATTLIALLALSISSGCTHHAFTPPTQTTPLETAAPIGAGRTALQGEVAAHGSVFNGGSASLSGRVRHGLTDNVEISGEANYLVVAPRDAAHTTPHVGSARIGVKHSLTRGFAFTSGLGFGLFAGGPFVGADVGFIASYDNDYVVPFFTGRLSLSIPTEAREVDTGLPNEPAGMFVNTVGTTGMAIATLGAEIKLTRDENATRHSLLLGFSFGAMHDLSWDEDHAETIGTVSGTVAYQVVLGR